MKTRKKPLGTENSIGAKVEMLRRNKGLKQKEFIAMLQSAGLDINPTSYSKLEGQIRAATDREVYFIAKTLGVRMEDLFDLEKSDI